MITTKAEVLNYIKEVTEYFNFDNTKVLSAQSVSQSLSISRSLASQYLNELYREEYLIKVSSRPVLYLHKEVIRYTYGVFVKNKEYLSMSQLQRDLDVLVKQDDLYSLIGSRGCLKQAVDQVKASVSYPPCGLPLLLTGALGTGKETLVRAVFKYAIENKIIQEGKKLHVMDLSFVSLNEIFKIFEQEDIGLIYFKNVETLNATDAMLLLDIVKGRYPEFEEVRLILAAKHNEYVDQALFEEIPLKSKLINFEKRYLEERKEFVIRFLQEESKKLKRTIRIQYEIIDLLANQVYTQQLKELQRNVQNICAKANSEAYKHKGLEIYLYHVSEIINQEDLSQLVMDDSKSSLISISELKTTDETLLKHYEHILLNGHDLQNPLALYLAYLKEELVYDREHVDDIKKLLNHLIKSHPHYREEVFLKETIDLLSLMIYTQKRNYDQITQWEYLNQHLLDNILLNVKNKQPLSFKRVEAFSMSVYNYTGISFNLINKIVLTQELLLL